LPSEILDFLPVYLVALSFSWVIVLGYFVAGLNNVFLVLSFLVWPAAVPLAHLVIGSRFANPNMLTRMPEYVISLMVFLYILDLVKEFVLISCRSFHDLSAARFQGTGQLYESIRVCFVYFLVHQTQIAQAYTILLVNTIFSLLIAMIDRLFCNVHTWWLLNNELARTEHGERYMENNATFWEIDGPGYGFDLWATDSDSDRTPRDVADVA